MASGGGGDREHDRAQASKHASKQMELGNLHAQGHPKNDSASVTFNSEFDQFIMTNSEVSH